MLKAFFISSYTQAINISKEESIAHGLPAIGISFTVDTSMMIFKFPNPNTWLTMSGPPGGVLTVSVEYANKSYRDIKSLTEFIKDSYTKMRYPPTIVKTETIEINKEHAECLLYFYGESLARTIALAILLPATIKEKTEHILLNLGVGGYSQPAAAEIVLKHPDMKQVIETFQLHL